MTRQRIAHLDTFRAGKLTRIVTYLDRAEAIEAGGTPESTISQENFYPTIDAAVEVFLAMTGADWQRAGRVDDDG